MISHVYIHIPFCIKKCYYCSFYSELFNDISNYIKVLIAEIDFYNEKYNIKPTSIYFGGGTPSLLQPSQIQKIISRLDTTNTKEITIEVNPATVSTQKLLRFYDAGINRFSIGVQSMLDKELKLLGRMHNTKDILSLNFSKLGNVSFDLIYGLPNQKIHDVIKTLRKLISMDPQHFSIYCLSLENDVPLYKMINQIPNDNILSDMYFIIKEILEQNRYIQYELSSFSKNIQFSTFSNSKKNTYESIHNLAYWSSKYYLGLGAGASGFLPFPENEEKNSISNYINENYFDYKKQISMNYMHYRYQNHNLSDYLQKKNNYIKNKIILSDTDFETDYIITGLRKTRGIEITEYEEIFKESFLKKYNQEIKKMLNNDMIIVNDYIKLNQKFYFLSNEVLCEFL